ncbi:MAG TPA: carboxypeptidase-like regulatory domain-containing protein [Verrucomicrobiae bacterium]|nr:carboxypeptidase-like regulatory domain-containing protein [Verrucomicrobiae bacterium]
MPTRKALLIVAAMLGAPAFAQQKGTSSPCVAEYENHNPIDCGPLVVQHVKGTLTDPQHSPMPKVCVCIFTEEDHKLVASTESDVDGQFFLRSIPPGRYRLVVKAEPLCAANVPLQIEKSHKKRQFLRVHMKPRGPDSCSYADIAKAGESAKRAATTP